MKMHDCMCNELQDLLLFDFHLSLCLPEFHKSISGIADMDSLIKTDFIKTTFFILVMWP